MNIAVIPARGGSKRIPGKNVKPFFGKPMIAWSIEAARESGQFGRIIVSTDSHEVADVARDCGAEVPFIRPAELSDDYTPMTEVFAHSLEWLRGQNAEMDYACCILATAPFLQAEDLAEGARRIGETGASVVFSVVTFDYPIFRALKTNDAGFLEMVWPEHEYSRSNDLPETCHDAGQFYWVEPDNYIATRRMFVPDATGVFLPRDRVQDIDTPEDWEHAEKLFAAFQQTRV